MKEIFLAYGTTEGQTAKIADFIADVLRGHGHAVTMTDVQDTTDTLSRDYVYTLRDGVKRFAEHFATDLNPDSPPGDLESS